MSVFNLNLEITAPECSFPEVTYYYKWVFIESLPIAAAVIFFVLHCVLWVRKRCCLGRRKNLNNHLHLLVGTLLVMFYYLYLYLTRTVLDVFNCNPTDPPDGYTYLSVVWERCWVPGGVQMRLILPAIVACIVYVLGYPVLVSLLLRRNRLKVMEDQLLRAAGKGRTRLDNPHPYDVRKMYHKIYYHFKPDK